jgi:hypothetical protein
MAMKHAGKLRIGLAVARDAVTAVVHGAERAEVLHEPIPAGGTDTEGIAAAIGALAGRMAREFGDRARDARVHVALLPPHCDVRLVQLPPLRVAEAVQVLRRDAARHFVGGTGARVVSVVPNGGPAESKGRPILGAAASVSILEAIAGMVRAAGWTLSSIVPAQAAWIAGVDQADGDRAGVRRRLIVAADTDAVHVVAVDSGVRDLRRVPLAWPEELAGAAGAGPGRAIVHANGITRDRIVKTLASAGWTIHDRGQQDSAATAAAVFAERSPMELAPPSLTVERQRHDRRTAIRAAVAAILLLAGVVALELWGVQRELASVRARRAEIENDVTPLLAVRDSLAVLEEWIAKVQSLDDASPRWSRALFDIAMLLPEDSHLVILQTSGDTLRAEVIGAKAGEALQALRPAMSLSGIRMEGVVERDLEEGTTSTERFRFTARLTTPDKVEQRANAASDDAPSVARRTP